MTMKEEIKEALVAATDEIFLKWQTKLHVISGDVNPLVAYDFDETLNKLAGQMVEILNHQPKLGVVKLEMMDGQIVDLSDVDMGYDIIFKLADVVEYLRERELI